MSLALTRSCHDLTALVPVEASQGQLQAAHPTSKAPAVKENAYVYPFHGVHPFTTPVAGVSRLGRGPPQPPAQSVGAEETPQAGPQDQPLALAAVRVAVAAVVVVLHGLQHGEGGALRWEQHLAAESLPHELQQRSPLLGHAPAARHARALFLTTLTHSHVWPVAMEAHCNNNNKTHFLFPPPIRQQQQVTAVKYLLHHQLLVFSCRNHATVALVSCAAWTLLSPRDEKKYLK